MIFIRGVDIIAELFGDVSKWGRCRALPVAEEARQKEWQRSKKIEHEEVRRFFRVPQQDITGRPGRNDFLSAIVIL